MKTLCNRLTKTLTLPLRFVYYDQRKKGYLCFTVAILISNMEVNTIIHLYSPLSISVFHFELNTSEFCLVIILAGNVNLGNRLLVKTTILGSLLNVLNIFLLFLIQHVIFSKFFSFVLINVYIFIRLFSTEQLPEAHATLIDTGVNSECIVCRVLLTKKKNKVNHFMNYVHR